VYGLAYLLAFTCSTFAIESISRSMDEAKGGLELPWPPPPTKKNGQKVLLAYLGYFFRSLLL
jgi:hypothetical protein